MKKQCTYIGDLFDAYLNGGLRKKDRISVEAHLKECSACRTALETEKQVLETLTSFPAHKCPDSVVKKILLETVHHKTVKKSVRVRRSFRLSFGFGTALAGAIAVAVLLLVIIHPFRKDPQVISKNYTKEELNRAKQQAKWSLVLVAQKLHQSEKKAVEDVLMNEMPSTIRKAIKKAVPILNGGSS